MNPQREERFRQVLLQRQPDLTVILENVHDPHNISAVVRTCETVGIPEVYVLHSIAPRTKRLGHKSSASARKWVKVNYFTDFEECIGVVREKGFSIWATHLSAESKSLYDLDLTKKTALVFGNEHEGITAEMLAEADGNFIIPMYGMIPSLNISVATGVSLYEALRQREAAGMYQSPALPQHAVEDTLAFWVAREERRKKRKPLT